MIWASAYCLKISVNQILLELLPFSDLNLWTSFTDKSPADSIQSSQILVDSMLMVCGKAYYQDHSQPNFSIVIALWTILF